MSLNEILKDMIIEYVNSPKLNYERIVTLFSDILPKLAGSSYRDLVLQWILLFEGLPTFNLSDYFTQLYSGLINLLNGDYELIMDQFYEKISLFFQNFKHSRKTPKHFAGLLKIIGESISRIRTWTQPMGKIYLTMLVLEQLNLLKDYLVFFNERVKQEEEEEHEEPVMNLTLPVKPSSSRNIPLLHLKRENSDRRGSLNLNSVHSSQSVVQEKYDRIEDFDKTQLSETLVSIFDLVLDLCDQDDEHMASVHAILFTQFKSLVKELDLETIVEMNQRLIEQGRAQRRAAEQSIMHGEATPRSLSSANSRKILESLNCFQEIVSILKTKTNLSKKDDEAVQLMFEGIVGYILREMYDSSRSVTDKIYKLLEEILVIRADMEEMVCRSLFECIRNKFSDMNQDKTKEFLQLVLNKISPGIFIKILVKSFKRGDDVDGSPVGPQESAELGRAWSQLMPEVLDFVTLILAFQEQRSHIIENLLFSQDTNPDVFELWTRCPGALAKAALFCGKFDLSLNILQEETERSLSKPDVILGLAKCAEDMLAIVDTSRFTRMMQYNQSASVKQRLVHLVAHLVMIAHNNPTWVSLLKKVKKNYWSAESPSSADADSLLRYSAENQRLFTFYLEIKRVISTPFIGQHRRLKSFSP